MQKRHRDIETQCLNEEQSYFLSRPRTFTVLQIYNLTVQSMIWQFRLLDRYTVLYPGHVSSLAGDLRGPVKNRKPRAIARIADALFFRGSLFIGTCRAETGFHCCGKRKRDAFVWRDHLIDLANRERRWRRFGEDKFRRWSILGSAITATRDNAVSLPWPR